MLSNLKIPSLSFKEKKISFQLILKPFSVPLFCLFFWWWLYVALAILELTV